MANLITQVPSGTTNGTALPAPPTGYTGIRFYLNTTDSVTFNISNSQPASAPLQFTIAGSNGPNWDEPLSALSGVFITSVVGSPLYRYK